MTTDDTGKPVFWVVQYRFVGRVSTYRRIWKFFFIVKSVTADGSLRSPTGGVEGINPAPHIHEQMATSNYVQMATTLHTPSRITTSRLSTIR